MTLDESGLSFSLVRIAKNFRKRDGHETVGDEEIGTIRFEPICQRLGVAPGRALATGVARLRFRYLSRCAGPTCRHSLAAGFQHNLRIFLAGNVQYLRYFKYFP